MINNVLKRYASQNSDKVTNLPETDEAEGVDDCGSFGWLRGIRDRAVMLELRKANGDIRAVGYGWLEKLDYNPSHGIVLHIGDEEIRIKGRSLNAKTRPLFEGIARHRVAWLQEADEASAMRAEKGKTVVEAIEW